MIIYVKLILYNVYRAEDSVSPLASADRCVCSYKIPEI